MDAHVKSTLKQRRAIADKLPILSKLTSRQLEEGCVHRCEARPPHKHDELLSVFTSRQDDEHADKGGTAQVEEACVVLAIARGEKG